ncbi:MAG: beta strand repeat-containing protein, partial [Planctomycetota bacterium]
CSALGGAGGNPGGGTAGQGHGGGIFATNGAITLMHVTIARNTASTDGGALRVFCTGSMSVGVKNSILSSSVTTATDAFVYTDPNTGSLSFPAAENGFNVIPAQGGSVALSTVSTNDPLLAATLTTAGGPTQTLPLLANSPARNAADGSQVASAPPSGPGGVDQRGKPRDNSPDVGALETQAVVSLDPTTGSNQSTAAGTGFTTLLVATAFDVDGDPVAGATVDTYTAPASGASATILPNVPFPTAADGAAVTSAAANASVGTYQVSLAIGATPAAIFTLTNAVGPPATIAVTAGGGQSATVGTGFANAIAFHVEDAAGNAVQGATITLTPPSSGASATFAPTSPSTDASGNASVNATANGTSGGPYSVTVMAGSASTTFSLTNSPSAPPPPASIVVVSGGGQSARVGTAFANPVVLEVRDGSGNALSGVTVQVTPPASGASVTFTGSTTTNGSGRVSLTPTANATAGAISVAASAGSAQTTFSLTSFAPTITLSGGSQSALVNTRFSAVVATARDPQGQPIAGLPVTFEVPSSGPSGQVNAPATTDSNGQMNVDILANGTPGDWSLVARSGSQTGSVTLTNLPAGGGGHHGGGGCTVSTGGGSSASVLPLVALVLLVVARRRRG